MLPSPQTCEPTNFHWCRCGAEGRVKRVQTRERGTPSVPAEFFIKIYNCMALLVQAKWPLLMVSLVWDRLYKNPCVCVFVLGRCFSLCFFRLQNSLQNPLLRPSHCIYSSRTDGWETNGTFGKMLQNISPLNICSFLLPNNYGT